MPITTDDIKIKASQRLTDTPDGGGYMTNVEVVDGSINKLFPNISRLDRTNGRVSIIKFFLHVDTDDTSTYYGAHLIVSKKTDDPNINVVLFNTESDSDTRTEARDRLESYVTLGPRAQMWLWGDQPAGARQLLVFAPVSAEAPSAGDVLCLFNNKDTASEEYQYVRITGVESEIQSLSVGSRQVLNIEIGDPLEVTFSGLELHMNDNTATSVYTTIVSDAARYFGAMAITAALSSGDTTVLVDSIYTQLVPTSQAETSMLSLTPGETGPVAKSGETTTQTITGLAGTLLYIGQAFVPGTLTLVISSITYTDRGDGVLLQGSNQAGTINYSTGVVTFSTAKSGSVVATYDPGVAMSLTPKTLVIPVPSLSAGYNYVAILWPMPEPGTITVDYMAEGNWYRLRDDGVGFLVPDIEGTGTGKVDYETGQVSITCAAIPDADTPILVRWGNPTEVRQMAGVIDIDVDPVNYTVASAPVSPGSLVITWEVGVDETGSATDDGNGNIVGDATGWINYGTGEMEFTPTALPVAGTDYTIDYEKYAQQSESQSGLNFTLSSVPEPGTVALAVPVSVDGVSHTYTMRDDGLGNLVADGWTSTQSQCRVSLDDSENYASYDGSDGESESSSDTYATDDTETTVTLTVGGISGTIDYVTGAVSIDLSTATATKKTIYAVSQSKTQSSDSFSIEN